MIFIDITAVVKPPLWRKNARKYLRRLKSKPTHAKRKKYIDRKDGYWGTFKPELQRISAEKCWFTEAPDIIGYFHVEHFRPKKEIVQLAAKFNYIESPRAIWDEGYWWLAFNWRNYRLSGFSTNSAYKKNYFPLIPGSPIAVSSAMNYKAEQPVLIDPCIEGEPDLITFDIDGKAIPSKSEATNKLEYDRADVSIKAYGINDHTPLFSHRQTILERCVRFLDRANRKFILLEFTADKDSFHYETIAEHFSDDCYELKLMIDSSKRDAYYTSMVRARIKSSGYMWVNDYVFS